MDLPTKIQIVEKFGKSEAKFRGIHEVKYSGKFNSVSGWYDEYSIHFERGVTFDRIIFQWKHEKEVVQCVMGWKNGPRCLSRSCQNDWTICETEPLVVAGDCKGDNCAATTTRSVLFNVLMESMKKIDIDIVHV